MPPAGKPIADPAASLASALEKPVGGTLPLRTLVKSRWRGGDVAVMVDDYTRPNDHTRLLLPILVEMLQRDYGIPAGKIKAVVCSGTHRAPTAAEMESIVGREMVPRIRVAVHDCTKNLAKVGEVEGHSLEISRDIVESDLVIALTDMDNHYFAGVAGGPKAFCPGVCSNEIITWEHLHMFDDEGFADNVALGIMDGNPVYECKKKIVGTAIAALRTRGTEVYCLAAVMDPHGKMVYLRGGETFALHRDAARKLAEVWTVTLTKRPEVVIAGAQTLGINLYQAGKAIHAAYTTVARGGHIMTVVPCQDGFGNAEYRNLMKIAADAMMGERDHAAAIRKGTLAVLEVVRRDFKIGKQKAVDFFRILQYVGWGHLHMIQDGLGADDKKILPVEFWGKEGEPALGRLKSWVQEHCTGKTLTVMDDPGYVVKFG
jgi:nickel-dependent lactate racemase